MTKSETKNPSSRGKRGLAPRALMDEGRRNALESLDRPASPASAFVRAALEAAAPHPEEESGTAPVSSRADRTAVAEAPASTSSASAGEHGPPSSSHRRYTTGVEQCSGGVDKV